jgi:DDE superfamily endonuclease
VTTLPGAGFDISRATAYRYLSEAITVLAARAGDLHDALRRVAADGWSYVILDGKLSNCDRLTETTLSVKGETIDAWYSGKHRDFAANIQAVMRPDGLPIGTSDAMPSRLHDLTCAQQQGVTAALNYSAAALDLPALADADHDRAGHGIKTPTRLPAGGHQLAIANHAVHQLLRGLRRQGERGFAILTGRYRTLRHTTASPHRIGDIVAAALHPTHFEYRYLTESR